LQKYATDHGVRISQDNDEKDEKKRVGKSKYFFPDRERFPLALGLEAVRGYFMSVRPSFKQLMVNINVAMAAFYVPGNLAVAMQAFQRNTGSMPKEFFDRLRVVTMHRGYPVKRAIFQIMSNTPRKMRFQCEEFGGQITVEDYFRRSKYLYPTAQCRADANSILKSITSLFNMPTRYRWSI
jgi:eukaryotic translation initiation factor 2C